MNTLKTIFCTLGLMLIISQAVSQVSGENVKILRSDERSLVFEYKPQYTEERVVRDGNVEMKVFNFSGAIPSFSSETIGAPDLRYQAIPLGFPAEDGNAVQVIASDYEDVAGVTLAPIPTMRLNGEMVEIAGYKNHSKEKDATIDPRHDVRIQKGSLLHSIVQRTEGEVNTNHHQAVKEPGRGLTPTVWSPDGLIEGLEWERYATRPFLQLVQWHPERMTDFANPLSKGLLDCFIHEVKASTKLQVST